MEPINKLTKKYTQINKPFNYKTKDPIPLFFKNKLPQKFVPNNSNESIQYNRRGNPFIDSLNQVVTEYNSYPQYNKLDFDERKEAYRKDPIYLPEVVKTPSQKDIKTKQYIQNLVPNKNTRDDLYKTASYLNLKDQHSFDDSENKKSLYSSDNDYALRLARLYNAAGSPNINRLSIQDNDWAKQERAYMEQGYIGKDNLYVNTPEDLISELSHSYGFKQGATPAIKSLVDDIMYGNPDNYYEKGKTGYNNPRHNEYQTHKVVEPNLYNFIRGNIKSMDIKDLNNKINQIKEQRIDRFGTSPGKYLLDSILSSKEK